VYRVLRIAIRTGTPSTPRPARGRSRTRPFWRDGTLWTWSPGCSGRNELIDDVRQEDRKTSRPLLPKMAIVYPAGSPCLRDGATPHLDIFRNLDWSDRGENRRFACLPPLPESDLPMYTLRPSKDAWYAPCFARYTVPSFSINPPLMKFPYCFCQTLSLRDNINQLGLEGDIQCCCQNLHLAHILPLGLP
jgi:hypothetical protein